MTRLVEESEFYNVLGGNCVTIANRHVKAVVPDDTIFFDWRLILSGHLDVVIPLSEVARFTE